MKRKDFLKIIGLSPVVMAHGPSHLDKLFEGKSREETMPVLFIGHGTPMNAITDNAFRRKWIELGNELPKPEAILCISAHWMTRGETKVLAMERPQTIHDFGGFPQKLFDQQYPAPGSPEFAKQTKELIQTTHVGLEVDKWGFDHGCWLPIMPMYPKADIPLYQLSIDMSRPPAYHYELSKDLKALRKKGVLIIGSGNIVHNLGRVSPKREEQYDWAVEFDEMITKHIEAGNHQAINDYTKMGSVAKLAVPTMDHYLPLMYVLALQDKQDNLTFFNDSIENGSISMRSVLLKG